MNIIWYYFQLCLYGTLYNLFITSIKAALHIYIKTCCCCCCTIVQLYSVHQIKRSSKLESQHTHVKLSYKTDVERPRNIPAVVENDEISFLFLVYVYRKKIRPEITVVNPFEIWKLLFHLKKILFDCYS